MKLFHITILLAILILTGCASVQSNATPEFTAAATFVAVTKEKPPAPAQQSAENTNRIEVNGGDEEALRDFVSAGSNRFILQIPPKSQQFSLILSDTETAIRLGLDTEPDVYRCDSGPYIGLYT